MPKATPNDGAAQTRGSIIRYLMRQKRHADQDVSVAIGTVVSWIRDMPLRSSARPGGLGRKKKATRKKACR